MKGIFVLVLIIFLLLSCSKKDDVQPNILFIISDDQSYPHASAYGYLGIKTPNFDRVADQGILFTNAYAQAPGCSPSRASMLTGLHIWQLEEAGSHASGFPEKFKTFPDILEKSGYEIGYTGKGWAPGDWKGSERNRNPAGPEYNKLKCISPVGMSFIDYYGNFRLFFKNKLPNKPFCFWYGAKEPHRVYKSGLGIARGLDTNKIHVPEFLPDVPEVVSDLADYHLEIEWFDQHLGRIIDMLDDIGELDNTLIIVTSDNGMPFPRAKANLYEYGTHVPLAIMWKNKIITPLQFDDPVGLIDAMPMIIEAAGIDKRKLENELGYNIQGQSLLEKLKMDSVPAVYTARERHSSARWNNLPYSSRAIREGDYLMIYNYFPERWPSGAPQRINANRLMDGYDDVDNSPTLKYMLTHQDDQYTSTLVDLFAQKRPKLELYNITSDPACVNNLINNHELQEKSNRMEKKLLLFLKATNDPRLSNNPSFDNYPRRKGSVREYLKPDWVK